MPSDPSGFYILKAGADVPVAGAWKPKDYLHRDFIIHGMFVMKCAGAKQLLAGFTTFNRFDGYFRFNTSGQTIRLSVVYDINLTLQAGQSLQLESFMLFQDKCFHNCLDAYTGYVARTAHARVPRRTATGSITARKKTSGKSC